MNDPARARVSAVVITLNAAGQLAECLASVAFADEILVVDSGSTDGTRELAEKYGARVVTRTTRQYALGTPSFNLWSIGLRYRLPSKASYDHTLALNINNLFDRDYLRVNRLIGEKRAILFTYTLNRTGAKR